MSLPESLPMVPGLLDLPVLSAGLTMPAQVHALLEQAIIDGRLEPESRIHADEIAAHFGVSRIPVREALRSLNEAGWVDIRPRYGVRVRSRDQRELTELFEFRARVEQSVAELAAERRSEEDVVEFTAITAAIARARADDDVAILDQTGLRFYAALRAAARNSVMAATSQSLEKRARFYYVTIADRLGLDWTSVHERIIALVIDRDAAAAGTLIHDHILATGADTNALLFPVTD